MIDRDRTEDCLLAFCHNGSVATPFMESVMRAFSTQAPLLTRRRLGDYMQARGPYIHSSRNRVAEAFLKNEQFQWLWFIDNDIEFEPDTLDRMLAVAEDRGVQILGAAYWNQYDRSGRYLSWLWAGDDGFHPLAHLPETDEPVEISAIGMGCTLIHREVLEAVGDAHTGDPWAWFAADVLRFEDGSAVRLGEDVSFCVRAAHAGFRIYGLPSVVVEHYKAIYLPHGMSPDENGKGVTPTVGDKQSLST